MKLGSTLTHLLAALVCVILLTRPDRLWSAVEPFYGATAKERLLPLVSPAFESADLRAGTAVAREVLDRVGATLTEGEIKSGQNLDQVLRAAGISARESLGFSRSFKSTFDPRKARPGDSYSVWSDREGKILRFDYRRSPVEIYRAVRVGDGWDSKQLEIEIERRQTTVAGFLTGSLWESFIQAGADADLIMGFIDLFGWDIDFAHESQPGDEFRAIYQTLYADGEFIGNGRILAASYRDRDETHKAFYWESEKSKGYYDQNGNSVRKSFLRAPLHFSRISSGYSHRRRHPVTRKVSAHLAIDYAAPTGTPVWAVGDGTVRFAARKGANGKMVIVRHARGYETYYLHLSRFAKGIRSGKKVEQGQVIAYVGSTGTATGPHLDYRVKKNGKWINPLREKFRPGPPVAKADKGAYGEWMLKWNGSLAAIPTKTTRLMVEAGK